MIYVWHVYMCVIYKVSSMLKTCDQGLSTDNDNDNNKKIQNTISESTLRIWEKVQNVNFFKIHNFKVLSTAA